MAALDEEAASFAVVPSVALVPMTFRLTTSVAFGGRLATGAAAEAAEDRTACPPGMIVNHALVGGVGESSVAGLDVIDSERSAEAGGGEFLFSVAWRVREVIAAA